MQEKQEKPQLQSEADEFDSDNPFARSNDRMGFIRKVYLIITAQMAVTATFLITFMYSPSLQYFIVFGGGWWLGLPCLFIMITCQIAIYCCVDVRRRVPINYIILFVFTLCMSYFATQVAVVEGYKQPWVVYMAAI